MKSRWNLAPWLVLAALVALGGVAAWADAEGEQVTVAGALIGIDEDADGNYKRVFLEQPLRGNILVADDEKGAELLAHAGSNVEITGRLVEQTNGDYGLLIYVESWNEMPDNEPGTIDPE